MLSATRLDPSIGPTADDQLITRVASLQCFHMDQNKIILSPAWSLSTSDGMRMPRSVAGRNLLHLLSISGGCRGNESNCDGLPKPASQPASQPPVWVSFLTLFVLAQSLPSQKLSFYEMVWTVTDRWITFCRQSTYVHRNGPTCQSKFVTVRWGVDLTDTAQ